MKKKLPQFLVSAGILLLLLAGVLKAYDMIQDYSSGHNTQLLLEQMKEYTASTSAQESVPSQPANSGEDEIPSDELNGQTETREYTVPIYADESVPPYTINNDADETPSDELEEQAATETSPTNLIYDVIGTLEIPALKRTLPVLNECTDSLLKVSVCRYMGTTADGSPNRLVIAGHSYKSHFGNLSKLALGDEVYFTTLSDIQYHYRVTEIIVIEGNDHASLEQGQWDITLFTCNNDGSKRILVRCAEEQ